MIWNISFSAFLAFSSDISDEKAKKAENEIFQIMLQNQRKGDEKIEEIMEFCDQPVQRHRQSVGA